MKVYVYVVVSSSYYDKCNVYSSEGDENRATKGEGVGKTRHL